MKKLQARVAADLIDKIFVAEGWAKTQGQNRTKMAHEAYTITREHDRYEAVRRA